MARGVCGFGKGGTAWVTTSARGLGAVGAGHPAATLRLRVARAGKVAMVRPRRDRAAMAAHRRLRAGKVAMVRRPRHRDRGAATATRHRNTGNHREGAATARRPPRQMIARRTDSRRRGVATARLPVAMARPHRAKGVMVRHRRMGNHRKAVAMARRRPRPLPALAMARPPPPRPLRRGGPSICRSIWISS